MSDYAKAILTLSTTSCLLYTIGFYCLFSPKKAKSIHLRWIEFLHKYRLHPWYEERKAMATDNRYLPIIRLSGFITIAVASFVTFLLIYKIRVG